MCKTVASTDLQRFHIGGPVCLYPLQSLQKETGGLEGSGLTGLQKGCSTSILQPRAQGHILSTSHSLWSGRAAPSSVRMQAMLQEWTQLSRANWCPGRVWGDPAAECYQTSRLTDTGCLPFAVVEMYPHRGHTKAPTPATLKKTVFGNKEDFYRCSQDVVLLD